MAPDASSGRDGVIVAVCRVHTLHPDASPVGVTAIDKRPVDGEVLVRRIGVRGDVQADREHHGGHDKALYAYAEESAATWAEQLGRPVPPGTFGENIRTRGIDVDGAVIGERWRIGDDVVAEVTQPRIPCGTFARRMDETDWVRRFTERGLPGAYLRVLATGKIREGDAIEVVERPDHGVRIGAWFTERRAADAEKLLRAAKDGELMLAPSLRRYAEHALAVRA